jgi:CheY-like chemotaxis protein
MSKEQFSHLAIIDLVGVIVDATERFRLATNEEDLDEDGKPAIDWKIAFKPEHVYKDELIKSSDDYVRALYNMDWKIVYMSSEPVSLYDVRVEWLDEYELIIGEGDMDVMLRPNFERTLEWKASRITHLVDLYKPKNVLVVDDEEAHRLVMEAALAKLQASGRISWHQVVTNMKEAFIAAESF